MRISPFRKKCSISRVSLRSLLTSREKPKTNLTKQGRLFKSGQMVLLEVTWLLLKLSPNSSNSGIRSRVSTCSSPRTKRPTTTSIQLSNRRLSSRAPFHPYRSWGALKTRIRCWLRPSLTPQGLKTSHNLRSRECRTTQPLRIKGCLLPLKLMSNGRPTRGKSRTSWRL